MKRFRDPKWALILCFAVIIGAAPIVQTIIAAGYPATRVIGAAEAGPPKIRVMAA